MFQKQWPWARVDAAEPTVIFAVKDEKSMRGLLPAFWQRQDGTRPAGISLVSPDRVTLVVRTDVQDEENPFAVLYHEYTHRLLALNFPSLPLWLNEGLAEFYGSSVIEGDDLTQGKPRPETIMLLRSSTLLPLETLFTVDQTSPHYNEQTRATIFYAQSWALVHYLILADKQAHTAQLNELVSQLRRGVSESEASAALGDLKALDRALASYVRHLVFTYRRGRDYLGEVDGQVRSRPLSPAETAAARGDFLARTGQVVQARALLDEAINLDPSAPEPYETQAALSLGLQKADEARKLAEKAIVLGTTNYFTWYLAGVLSAKQEKGGEEAQRLLRRSLELNPDYAPTSMTLASLLATSEASKEESARLALRVPELAPTNFIMHLAAAETLVRIDRTEEARAIAARIDALAPAGPLKEAARKLVAGAVPKDPTKRLAFHLKGCDEGNAADCTSAGERYAKGTGVARDYPRSVELFQKACDAKYAYGCAWLGSQYENGHGVAKDEVRAAALYESACAAQNSWACARLGILYLEGRGVNKDAAKAQPHLDKGCEGGDEWGCTKLAWLSLGNEGVAADFAKAARLYEKGCGGANAHACAGLAWMFSQGQGVAKDETRATELYRKACENDDGPSCATVGYRYQKGIGTTVDLTAAATLLQRGCDQNDADSCVDLADFYSEGVGVSRDLARAAELFVKGCDQGDGLACEAAGEAHYRGRGVSADPKRAFDFYEKACAARKSPSCSDLAGMLLKGIGTRPDPERAIALLKKECDAKGGRSCGRLSYCYSQGLGVPIDLDQSAALRKKACTTGFTDACTPSDLTPEMVTAVMAEAEKECAGGVAASCGAAGEVLIGQSRHEEAVSWFNRACDAGHASSCAQLATAYVLGRGVAPDAERARGLYKKACAAGEESACEALKLTK
jgi:TPR repeat protein